MDVDLTYLRVAKYNERAGNLTYHPSINQ